MNEKIVISAIFMALSSLGLCASEALVSSDEEELVHPLTVEERLAARLDSIDEKLETGLSSAHILKAAVITAAAATTTTYVATKVLNHCGGGSSQVSSSEIDE